MNHGHIIIFGKQMLVHLKQKLIATILKHKHKQHIPNNCADDVCHPLDGHGLITYLDLMQYTLYNLLFVLYTNITTNHTHKRKVCFLTCLRTTLLSFWGQNHGKKTKNTVLRIGDLTHSGLCRKALQTLLDDAVCQKSPWAVGAGPHTDTGQL